MNAVKQTLLNQLDKLPLLSFTINMVTLDGEATEVTLNITKGILMVYPYYEGFLKCIAKEVGVEGIKVFTRYLNAKYPDGYLKTKYSRYREEMLGRALIEQWNVQEKK